MVVVLIEGNSNRPKESITLIGTSLEQYIKLYKLNKDISYNKLKHWRFKEHSTHTAYERWINTLEGFKVIRALT